MTEVTDPTGAQSAATPAPDADTPATRGQDSESAARAATPAAVPLAASAGDAVPDSGHGGERADRERRTAAGTSAAAGRPDGVSTSGDLQARSVPGWVREEGAVGTDGESGVAAGTSTVADVSLRPAGPGDAPERSGEAVPECGAAVAEDGFIGAGTPGSAADGELVGEGRSGVEPAARSGGADESVAVADRSSPVSEPGENAEEHVADSSFPAGSKDSGAGDSDHSGMASNPGEFPDGALFEESDAGERLDEAEFRSALEAMLLVVDAPAAVEMLASALDDRVDRVERALREMSAELTARRSGMDLRFVGDGWRYYTRTEFAPYVERMLLDGARSKLTRAALETLAVIAYRQPVTRARVSAVRGVNVDGVIRTLLARGLISEAGADPETNGTLYVTTELFLERIGLASLTDLPPLAPLLPGVDLIDEINESLETDPRYTKLRKPTESDIDLGTEE